MFNVLNADNILDTAQGSLLFNFDGTIRSGLGDTRRAQSGDQCPFLSPAPSSSTPTRPSSTTTPRPSRCCSGRPDRVEVLGVTVVAGNHTAPQGAEHMLHLLELAGRRMSPCTSVRAPPSSTPRNERAARHEARWGPIAFKGAFDAEPDVRPPHGGRFAAVRPRPADAASFIIDTIERRPNEITLVAVGPMTNLAQVFRARPDLAPRVKRLVFMGGAARVPGNVTPAAEFNIWFDPDAAAEVLRAGVPSLVMFGLDVTNHAPVRKPLFDRIVAAGTPLTRLMQRDMGPRYARDPAATHYVWDCITAAGSSTRRW